LDLEKNIKDYIEEHKVEYAQVAAETVIKFEVLQKTKGQMLVTLSFSHLNLGQIEIKLEHC